jgi:hypothetical protein
VVRSHDGHLLIQRIGVHETGSTPVYKYVLVRAVKENSAELRQARSLAYRIVYPMVNWCITEPSAEPPIEFDEVRKLLCELPVEFRAGIVANFADYVGIASQATQKSAADVWDDFIGPLFSKLWPQERKYQDGAIAESLMRLCVSHRDGIRKGIRRSEALLHSHADATL